MAKILVSGLVNVETTCAVRQFPVEYYPIDYPFLESGPRCPVWLITSPRVCGPWGIMWAFCP